MRRRDHPSPNCEPRTRPVDMLVLHYTGMPSAEAALERLSDPTPGKRVSAHYLVDEDGTVYSMVPEDRTAWHAGKSAWRGQEEINARSVGIEIVNPGHEHGYRPFPQAQMDAVAALSREIIERHRIPSWNVVAHSDIAPGRKQDPGELFPWQWLAGQGVGMWPEAQPVLPAPGLFSDPVGWVMRLLGFSPEAPLAEGDNGPAVLAMQKKLAAFGYPAPQCSTFGNETKDAVVAFQRHWRPEKVDGIWDAECAQRLDGLLRRAPVIHSAREQGRDGAL